MSQSPIVLLARARTWAAYSSWHGLVLIAILALSAFLELFRITREGYSNTYYAATVKSMLTSWHNFFFASYDPGGFVTVDKPPLGFWVQAASAKLFGFHGWSLLLPQALAAVLSVALLYYLVRRSFGPVAGLLAALTLALAPITVATARNNTVDVLLVLVLLMAAWAVVRAAETGRLHWLLLCAALVGLGFNIKMLQAYLVVPAFFLLYFVAAPRRRWTRVAQLGLATVMLLVVSLSWAVAVDLTPADERPYVGGSKNNTVLNLIVGYNGLERLLGLGGLGQAPIPHRDAQSAPPSIQNAGSKTGNSGDTGQPKPGQGKTVVAIGGGAGGEAGSAGPLRLLNEQLAGQVGWLLPLALLGMVAAGWQTPLRWREGLDGRHQALLLWGAWLLTAGAFFSVADFWHRYYLVVLSPAIAALVGAGVVALWDDYRRSRWRWWILPAALVGMAALHAYILADYADWSRRLTPAIVGLCAVAATALVAARLSKRLCRWAPPEIAAAMGVLALFIAPTTWAAIPVWNAPGDWLPYAGPKIFEAPPAAKSNPSAVQVGLGATRADPKLVEYLLDNRGDARFLVAVPTSAEASPLILSTGEPVMALGGFGGDQILTADELARLVASGELRFLLLPGEEALESMPGGKASSSPTKLSKAPATGAASGVAKATPPMGKSGPSASTPDGRPVRNGITGWVREHCTPVPPERWRSKPSGDGGNPLGPPMDIMTLYNCGGEAR